MPKADSSCTRITRRAAIATVAAGVVQPPVRPALASSLAPRDPIFAAIAAHRAAYRRFNSAVDVSASLYPSDPRTDAAEEITAAASEALERAAIRLTAVLPASFAGILALLAYLDDFNLGRLDESDCFFWPDDVSHDGLRDAEGEPLTMPFAFWIMRNIHAALQKLVPAG